MTEEKIQANNSSDDIDLIGLLERIVIFFRRFGKIFIIAIIAGIVLGGTGYFLFPKQYQSKMILHSSYLTNQEEIEIVVYWNELLKRKEYRQLSPILHCREDLLNDVVSLEGEEIQKNYSSTDPNGFYINAKVKNNGILTELQNSIVYGLNNSEYVKQKLEARKQDLNNLISKMSIQISKLDSVKQNIENIISNKEKTSSPFIADIAGINREWIELNEKVVGYQNELKFISSVHVLQSFIPLDTTISRSLIVSIVMALIVCLAVAYIYAILKYIEDRLKKRVKSNA